MGAVQARPPPNLSRGRLGRSRHEICPGVELGAVRVVAPTKQTLLHLEAKTLQFSQVQDGILADWAVPRVAVHVVDGAIVLGVQFDIRADIMRQSQKGHFIHAVGSFSLVGLLV